MTAHLFHCLAESPELTILGPQPKADDGSGRAALASFTAGEAHPHDLSTILDDAGIAIRSEHHCTQSLHRVLDMSSGAQASLYFYNTHEEIDTFVEALKEAIAFFGGLFG